MREFGREKRRGEIWKERGERENKREGGCERVWERKRLGERGWWGRSGREFEKEWEGRSVREFGRERESAREREREGCETRENE